MTMTHSWSAPGTFHVTAQAKDKRGAVSGWSSARSVLVIQGWATTYGGTHGDFGNSVQQTQDGGYIIAGSVHRPLQTYSDVWLIKTDAAGDKTWDRTFGGTSPDCGCSVQQTRDGGYIIAGWTGSFSTSYDLWLIKTDAGGNSEWTKTFGGTDKDEGNSVQQTTDGGYIVAGWTKSFGAGRGDVWLIKTDAHGDTMWTRTFGGASLDEAASIQQTTDGGYVVVGTTHSYGVGGSSDVWLIKADAHGDSVWTRTFGGGGADYGNSVRQTQDGGYIITGRDGSHSTGIYGTWLFKTDADGSMLWTRTFGEMNEGSSVWQTQDGGYVVAGHVSTYALLLRTDANGDSIWDRIFGGAGTDAANSVEQTNDGGYIVTGWTKSFGAGKEDAWLIHIAADGRLLSQ